MLSPLPAAFRARWPHHPTPMIIVHSPDEAEHICPAPTLWTGGRAVAQQAKALGLGPGHRVALALPLGIEWIQALVGCLRVGVCCVLADPARDPATLAAHGHVGPSGLALTAPTAPLGPAEARVAFGEGGLVLDEPALVAKVTPLATALCPAPDTRVLSRNPWWTPAGLLGEVLPTLMGAGELHLLRAGACADDLGDTGSRPQALVADADGWRRLLDTSPDWVSSLQRGLLLTDTEEDALLGRAAAQGLVLTPVEPLRC